jgi:hypothetical protein
MRRLISTSIFFALFISLSAQVTLNKRYEYSTSVVKLETLGYKYYLMDVPNGQCRIYNTDHSLFKTINCNVPGGFYLSDVKLLSEKLFDTDPGIEMLCTFYKYNSSKAYYEYDSKIINEDGSQIQFIDGGIYNYINKTDETTYQLFSYCYDYSIFPEKVWTNIYNLPGSPVVSAIINNDNPDYLLNAFPNPATQSLKVAYTLPENVTQGTLYIVDNTGRQVNQFIVDKHTDFLMLVVSRFQSGVYHYFIEYGNTKTPAKQLIVN